MPTTNTDYTWYYYIRKKGNRYYLGLVNESGDAPDSAYDIDIYYDEFPDDLDDQDDTFPIPQQFELGFIKGVVAELMSMSSGKIDERLKAQYMAEYERCVHDAIRYQGEESDTPSVLKPFDFRDDHKWGRYR